MSVGMIFWSFSQFFFFNLLYCNYEFCLQNFERLHQPVEELYQLLWEIGWTVCRYDFLVFFSNYFFNLLYYSYAFHIQIFKRLQPPIQELHQSLWKIGWTMSAGTSFWSFFFIIIFLILSTIATHFIYKFLKGYIHPFKSYINFCRK